MAAFDRARLAIENEPWFDQSWRCQSGYWPNRFSPEGVVLRLAKDHWSNERLDDRQRTSGIFFSVWTDQSVVTQFRYNIHALKLRELTGYRLEREFCRDTFEIRSAASLVELVEGTDEGCESNADNAALGMVSCPG